VACASCGGGERGVGGDGKGEVLGEGEGGGSSGGGEGVSWAN